MPADGTRPTRESVTTAEFKTLIFDRKLKLESPYRQELQQQLIDARKVLDRGAIAYCAFSLAYSYDHYEPYEFAKAVELLGEALAYFPEWPEALFNRGVAGIHLKQFDQAIRDLEAADKAYFGSHPPNVLDIDQADLIHGKLLAFLAEARCGRRNAGDFDLARSELARAEAYFLRCLDKSQLAFDARHWLSQIPSRLKATIPQGSERTDRDRIQYPSAFLCGVIAVPIVLWWLVVTTSRPLRDSPPAGPTEKTANTDSSPTSKVENKIDGSAQSPAKKPVDTPQEQKQKVAGEGTK